ncbi:MAG: type II secretion system protein GspD [bacterium]
MKRLLIIFFLMFLYISVVKQVFAGTVNIINPISIHIIKPNLPVNVSNQRVSLKGDINIKELEFMLSGQIKQTIELIGNSKEKAFVHFNNAKLINVLKYIKTVYGFNYKYVNHDIRLFNVETIVFHLPVIPLYNSVSASLGSSSGGMGSSGSSSMGSSSGSLTGSSGTSGGSSSIGSGSLSSMGGMASERVSNMSTPFFKKIIKIIKGVMSKRGRIMYSPRNSDLVIRDYVKNIELVKKFINSIKKSMRTAIFIKLKVINIDLSSGYNYGINWNNLYSDMGRYLGAASLLSVNLSNTPHNSLSGSDTIMFNSGNGTQAIISALNNFGSVSIVNQTKLEVLAGQTRSLNDMTTIPYLEGNQITSIGALGSSAQSTPQLGSANSGINVVYTPIIYHKKVYISVQLILNTIDKFTNYTSGKSTFSLPEVSTKSVSFTVKVPSGKSALVGALQYKSTSKNSEGIPVLSNIPILGLLFSGKSKTVSNNELFLLITPVIIKR